MSNLEKNPVDPNDLEEILSEIDNCREDERSSQSQIVQVIATAGTILTLIFSANYIMRDKEASFQCLLFHLSNFVFCTAVGYIATIGVNNVLRYQYLRNLEDRLFLLTQRSSSRNAKQLLVHWMSFSAPVMTKNPQHLKSQYAWMNYMCYTIATVSAVAFCAVITIVQYTSIEHSIYEYISFGLLIVLFSLATFTFFYASYKAKDIYNFAWDASFIDREKRVMKLREEVEKDLESSSSSKNLSSTKELKDGENGKTDKNSHRGSTWIFEAVSYFIYPKKKDLPKPALLALGFITGMLLYQDKWSFGEGLKQFAIVFITIDFLLYQARYQWNDIRGLKQDRDAGKKGRLPRIGREVNDRLSVKVSMAIMVVRIISLIVILCLVEEKVAGPLSVCSIVITLVAFIYEFARTKQLNWLIFFMVGFGYPLRFLAGLWAANPQMLDLEIVFAVVSKIVHVLQHFRNCSVEEICATAQYLIIPLLLCAYAFWGASSAILAWAHEATAGKSTQKSYCECLAEKANRKVLSDPLNGNWRLPWNWRYIASMICLSVINVLYAWNERLGIGFAICTLALEVWTIMFSINIANLVFFFKEQNKRCFVAFYVPVVFKSVIYSLISSKYLFYLYIGLTQALFATIYFFLRYYFDPDFDFVNEVKKMIVGFIRLIIGRETFDYINNMKQ